MFGLSPKDDKFFDYFIDTAQLISQTAEMLIQLMNNLENPGDLYRKIEEKENQCDTQVHIILEQLNKSFITPIDREDIYAIARELDTITDFIESSAHRLAMFRVTKPTKEAVLLARLSSECSVELISLMKELKTMKFTKKLSERIIEINRIEGDGDIVFRQAVQDLFSGDVPALEVIKWKEIYEHLECVLDAYEDVANLIEGVVMKHV